MFRNVIVLLAGATAALGQTVETREDVEARRPHQFGNKPTDESLTDRARVLIGPVNTGLITASLPDEALIDVEDWVRSPIPGEERAIRRIGFRRPGYGTVFREPINWPLEETMREDVLRLRQTIRQLQGTWRVQKMTLDGRDLRPEEYAVLKYQFQSRVQEQSETSEQWLRNGPITLKQVGDRNPDGTTERQSSYRTTNDSERLGPTATRRPPPSEVRNDPKDEEAVRLQLLHQGEGRATVFWWDRYGESVDPHLSRNRNSIRVSHPTRGKVEVVGGTVTLAVRGVGLRFILPTKFHHSLELLQARTEEERTLLESNRSVVLVMVRDEDVNPPPLSEPKRQGDKKELGPGEPGSRRVNIIPQLHRVPLEVAPYPPQPVRP